MTSGSCSGSAWLGALLDDLLEPPQRTNVATAADLWRIERVMILCDRPPSMADYPELSVRLRGAFGRRLHETPARPRRGWDRPPAAAVLFDEIEGFGQIVPKPFVVRGAVHGETLAVELLIFGWAGVYRDEAAEAMMRALRQGIALAPDVRHRVPVAIREAGVARTEGIEVDDAARSATMIFRTPVTVRNERRLVTAPSSIVAATVRRVAGLARWQGIELDHDQAALTTAAEALAYDDRDLAVYRGHRHSQHRGDVPIPVAGQLGRLHLGGNLAPLLPYLAIAAHANIGSHATLGFGWYDLIV